MTKIPFKPKNMTKIPLKPLKKMTWMTMQPKKWLKWPCNLKSDYSALRT